MFREVTHMKTLVIHKVAHAHTRTHTHTITIRADYWKETLSWNDGSLVGSCDILQ